MFDNPKMLNYSTKHAIFLLLLGSLAVTLPCTGAQNTTDISTTTSSNEDPYKYATFSPSMAVIISVIITALFFMGFFSIYIRHCSRSSTGGSIRPVTGVSNGRSRRRGLDAALIENFPTFPYSEVKHLKIGKNALECAVCLNEFEDEETLRLLPKCDHVFHPECIDAWLSSHTTCPVCRANLTDTVVTQNDVVLESSAQMTSEELEETELRTSVSVRLAEEIRESGDEETEPSRPNKPNPNGSLRSRSIKSIIFSKFPRSHSTGHSLVQPGENMERFTLRLPEDVRKQIMSRKVLNRTTSLVVLPRESSSRRGYRTGEGSSRGRYFKRLESMDRAVRSDPWLFTMVPPFFTRASSIKSPTIKSPRSNSNAGEGSSRWSGLIGRMSFNRLGSRRDKSMPSDSNRLPV